jgi:hypothetical protein
LYGFLIIDLTVVREAGVESGNLEVSVRFFSAVQACCFAELGRWLRLVHVPVRGKVYPSGVRVPMELQAKCSDLVYRRPGFVVVSAAEGYNTV